MKKVISGLISKLDRTKERVSELEAMTVQTSKIENIREKKSWEKNTEYPRALEQLQKCVTNAKWGYQKKRKGKNRNDT